MKNLKQSPLRHLDVNSPKVTSCHKWGRRSLDEIANLKRMKRATVKLHSHGFTQSRERGETITSREESRREFVQRKLKEFCGAENDGARLNRTEVGAFDTGNIPKT